LARFGGGFDFDFDFYDGCIANLFTLFILGANEVGEAQKHGKCVDNKPSKNR
jgi:hypothetical protein